MHEAGETCPKKKAVAQARLSITGSGIEKGKGLKNLQSTGNTPLISNVLLWERGKNMGPVGKEMGFSGFRTFVEKEGRGVSRDERKNWGQGKKVANKNGGS